MIFDEPLSPESQAKLAELQQKHDLIWEHNTSTWPPRFAPLTAIPLLPPEEDSAPFTWRMEIILWALAADDAHRKRFHWLYEVKLLPSNKRPTTGPESRQQ